MLGNYLRTLESKEKQADWGERSPNLKKQPTWGVSFQGPLHTPCTFHTRGCSSHGPHRVSSQEGKSRVLKEVLHEGRRKMLSEENLELQEWGRASDMVNICTNKNYFSLHKICMTTESKTHDCMVHISMCVDVVCLTTITQRGQSKDQ